MLTLTDEFAFSQFAAKGSTFDVFGKAELGKAELDRTGLGGFAGLGGLELLSVRNLN